MAQAKELFLAHSFLELETGDSRGKAQASTFRTALAAANLHIDESRARAFLGTGTGEEKLDGWYLDSSATHHMTGRHELFSDLDFSVRGSVRFGNSSRVEIQGVESIVFVGKTSEHRLLHGVYFIPTLRNSIMSLGQLDEGGSVVEIDNGIVQIWDRCSLNHLYVHLEVARPLCSPRAKTMKRGAGTNGSTISTSRCYTSWARRLWHAGCR
jgi:hypothetical protein